MSLKSNPKNMYTVSNIIEKTAKLPEGNQFDWHV